MTTIEFDSLPIIQFAHMYQAERYENTIPPIERRIEVCYVDEGCLTILCDGGTVVAEKGDILCSCFNDNVKVFAPQFHRHYSIGITVDWRSLTDNFNGLFLPRVTRHSNETAVIGEWIKELIFNQSTYTASPTKSAATALELLCRIDEYNRQKKTFEVSGEALYTQKAKRYVEQHLYEPITQSEIAEVLGISSGYLCSVFKRTEGIPLMQYINKTKLMSLRDLLLRENVHLYEAAEMFGYSDPNYVSRLYKKLFGYNITDRSHTVRI